jgi:tetratricopeptide (TPR) repeat protein
VDAATSEDVPDGGAAALLARLEAAKAEADEAARIAAEDDALLWEMEEIRASFGASDPVVNLTREERLGRVDGRYQAAIDSRFSSLTDAAARMKASRHASAFSACLCHWAINRQELDPVDRSTWQEVYRAACAVDPANADLFEALVRRDAGKLVDLARTRGKSLASEMAALLGGSLRRLGQPEAGIELMSAHLARSPDSFCLHMELAYAGEMLGRIGIWIEHAEAASALRPKSVEGWSALGDANTREEDWSLARAAYEKGRQLDPRNPGWRVAQAQTLLSEGKPDVAETHIREALALDPSHSLAQGILARIQQAHGHYDAAEATYRGALALAEDQGLSRKHRATLHGNLAVLLSTYLGRFGEAVSHCQRSIELWPALPQVRLTYGAILCDHLHRYDEAIAQFRKAIELNPEQPMAYANLGIALQWKGKKTEAIAAWRRSIELGASPVAESNLGLALFAMGKQQEGLAHLKRGAELDPHSAWALGAYGNALVIERQIEPGFMMIRKALRLFGGQPLDPRRYNLRYNAACASALLYDKLQAECLAWLRADLTAWESILASGDAATVAARLRHWKKDPDLASVRDADDLPEDWKRLWADVDALLTRAEEAGK